MTKKHDRPLVSIVVPVFNVEKYLGRCLSSLNAQTYGEIEIIIVNDGSTDESWKIIENFEPTSRFPLRVINQKNSGLGAARNIGFRHTKGKYIAFIDSDDFVSSRLCEIAVNCAMDTGADIVEFGYLATASEHVDETLDASNETEILSKRRAIIGLSPMAWNKLYDRQLLVKAKLRFPPISHEDEAEIYRLALFANRVVRIRTALYYYCQRADSITGLAVNSRTVDLLKVADILFDIAKRHPLYYCEFIYKSITMLYRCRNTWESLNEEWSNRALTTALRRLKEMEPFELDNPYFFVAKEISKEYENSTSWRLTKPMRALIQILGRKR